MKRKESQNSNTIESEKIGISYLKQIWSTTMLQKKGIVDEELNLKHNYVSAVFDALGIGIEPTYQYLFNADPSFVEFEDWILKNGNLSEDMIALFNTAYNSQNKKVESLENEELILNNESLKLWEEDGYVIIPNAISQDDCNASVTVIQDFLKIDLNDESTWYKHHPEKQGIMVQLFNHEQLNKNRTSKIIRQAYQQLWNRNDLILSMDRTSFNPPETDIFKFPGPDLHWDVSLKQPMYFGVQGLLYLTDTPANQGAFTLVPGFHRKIEKWLEDLPKNVNPREYDLHQLGAKPISGNAGDFIIWNHKLPHGSSPNTGMKPRIVQYINYQPLDREIQTTWL